MALTLPAGLYFVGDPCYAFAGGGWDAVCGTLASMGWPQCCTCTVNGRAVAVLMTTHGDGTYEDGDGNKYTVDSGSLGAVQIVSPLTRGALRHLRQRGTVTRFEEAFTCARRNGVIAIGGVEINTN
jgi:hypothetical protein